MKKIIVMSKIMKMIMKWKNSYKKWNEEEMKKWNNEMIMKWWKKVMTMIMKILMENDNKWY